MFFTGSVGAGRAVARACAERLVPCALELGGSDAAIVLADAHLATAAQGLVWGRFSNAGQTCVAPKRIYIEAPVYDAFLEEVAREVARLTVGAGTEASTEVSAMIRPRFRAVIEAQRDDAVRRGARVVCAATSTPAAASAFPPTVLADVPEGARVLTEETFGPLMVVIRVQGEAEAVARANTGDFALSASVWSASTDRASRIADQLACGTVAINDVLLTPGVPELPHGGTRLSGYDRVNGVDGIASCLRSKGVVVERLPRWGQTWWFGYSAERLSGVDAFVRFAHAPSLMERLRALPGFVLLLLRGRRR